MPSNSPSIKFKGGNKTIIKNKPKSSTKIVPKRRRWEKKEKLRVREKGLTHLVRPTAGHQGPAERIPPGISAQLSVPKPPNLDKGSASGGI